MERFEKNVLTRPINVFFIHSWILLEAFQTQYCTSCSRWIFYRSLVVFFLHKHSL